MILLLGASGYVGQAFADELRRRECPFIPLTRQAFDYAEFDLLFDYMRKMRPVFVINASGSLSEPKLEANESGREETLFTNSLLPQTIARVCLMTKTPWGHVSSGGIYRGAKVIETGRTRIETDLNRPDIRLLLRDHPERFRGFTEWDEPNSSFRNGPCSFFSGTKVLAEEAIRGLGQNYIWRIAAPFDEHDQAGNLLSDLQNAARLRDDVVALSHLADFVRGCLGLWERQAPFGTYNMANPGVLTTRQVAQAITRILKPSRPFEFWKEGETTRESGRLERCGCILDGTKLLTAGVVLRPVADVLRSCLRDWRPAGAEGVQPGQRRRSTKPFLAERIGVIE
jgi:dTDP-4-dehydrorhamnose reductase